VCCFFSSRRRHTRFSRDWSSDVCSSDLIDQRVGVFARKQAMPRHEMGADEAAERGELVALRRQYHTAVLDDDRAGFELLGEADRSEERRVGKERDARWRERKED